MTSIMLSAVLVMGLTSPAYADDESPLNCTNNNVAQGFDTTDKITAVGQNIEVLTATIGNPSQIVNGVELSCDYTVTAQEVIIDIDGNPGSAVLINGGANDCVGDTIVAGDLFHVCSFVPATGYASLITDISIGDFWRLTLNTSRDVAVHNGAQNVATNSDNTELKLSDATLTKAVNPDKIVKGESTSVTYTYVATNTAASDLDCGLVDDKLGVIYAPKAFASGASDTSTKTTTLTAGVTNLATLTCTDQAGVTFTRTATTTVTDIEPKVTLEKSVTPDKVLKGVSTTVTYSYKVTNTGDTSLDCDVTDDKLGTIGSTITLATNGATQTLTQGTTISNAVTNIGTVFCTAQIGDSSATSTATVREINPNIDVDKTCVETVSTSPGTIDYTIVVTNTGNTLLTGVVLNDATLGISKTIGSLTAGASDTTTASATGLAAGSYTNTADASGTDQLNTKVMDNDDATCEITGEPDLEYFVGGGKVIVPNGEDKTNQGKKGEQTTGNAFAKATNKKLSDSEFILTHGFQLHCDVQSGPNNLEINWLGNQFHLEQLTQAICTDDGSVNEPPPSTDTSENGPGPTTDVYTGEGFGRYNGVCGAFAEWVFDDNGEPGKADHIVALRIVDVDKNPVFAWNTGDIGVTDTSSAGTWKEPEIHLNSWLDLRSGNHQWVPHPSGPHGPTQTNPCPEFTN